MIPLAQTKPVDRLRVGRTRDQTRKEPTVVQSLQRREYRPRGVYGLDLFCIGREDADGVAGAFHIVESQHRKRIAMISGHDGIDVGLRWAPQDAQVGLPRRARHDPSASVRSNSSSNPRTGTVIHDGRLAASYETS